MSCVSKYSAAAGNLETSLLLVGSVDFYFIG